MSPTETRRGLPLSRYGVHRNSDGLSRLRRIAEAKLPTETK